MRTRIRAFLLVLVVVALALTSCSTTIAVSTLVPAEVDVSGYKTIAVMSTQDNSRWTQPVFWNSHVPIRGVDNDFLYYVALSSFLDFGASSTIINTATDTIYKALDTGLSYKVLDPEYTDALVTVGKNNGNLRGILMDNGVDAILKTEISYIGYDEYIKQDVSFVSSTDSSGKTYYKKYFYYVQTYAMSISYTLTDVENNKILATGTFSSGQRQEETQIGTTIDANDTYKESYYSITPASRLFRDLIKEFSDSFRNALAPHYSVEYFSFMKNKPKVKSLEAAYDALDEERWLVAQDLFYREYAASGHVNAGINAAILYFANGDSEKGMALAQEIYNKYGSQDALEIYYELKAIYDRENAAVEQINSDVKSGSATSGTDLIGF